MLSTYLSICLTVHLRGKVCVSTIMILSRSNTSNSNTYIIILIVIMIILGLISVLVTRVYYNASSHNDTVDGQNPA